MKPVYAARRFDHEKAVFWGSLVILVVVGFGTAHKYGFSYDEIFHRREARLAFDLYFHGDTKYLDSREADHGCAFEVPLYALQWVFGAQEDPVRVHYFRHLVTYLFFLGGAVSLFALVRRETGSFWLSMLAFLFLVLHPRIYSHAFFNTKDLPFMTMICHVLNVASLALRTVARRHFLLLGVVIGFATGIRIMGVLHLVLCCLPLVWMIARKPRAWRVPTLNGVLVCVSFAVTLYLVWPHLWGDPVGRFVEVFRTMSRFDRWGGRVLMFGQRIPGEDVPWYYTLAWIGITTPLVFLFFLVAGLGVYAQQLIVRWRDVFSRDLALPSIAFLAAVLPIVATIVAGSTLYSGWRHSYFVYPPLVFLAAWGTGMILRRRGRSIRFAVSTVLVMSFVAVVHFSIQAFPLQYVYFNPLVSRGPEELRRNFAMDYWGTAFRPALVDFARQHADASGKIKLAANYEPGLWNLQVLPNKLRERFEYVRRLEDADYFISNYRNHPGDYDVGPVVYDRKVLGSSVVTIWKVER